MDGFFDKPIDKKIPIRLVLPNNKRGERFSVLSFHSSNKINYDSKACLPIYMCRENHVNALKFGVHQDKDDDGTAKMGPNTVYGQEARDEARRRRYSHKRSKSDGFDQPWLLTTGKGKSTKEYRGTKEPNVSRSSSYYIFKKLPSGELAACPVTDWFKMTPRILYNYLNEDEAEEEFNKRHKTYNHFNVMVRKRLNDDENRRNRGENDSGDSGDETRTVRNRDGAAADAGSLGYLGRRKINQKSNFKIVEADESDDRDDDDDDQEDSIDENGTKSVQQNGQKKQPANKKSTKQRSKSTKNKNSDNEVGDESDVDDHMGDEVDYITSSDEDEDNMSEGDREAIYTGGGVEDQKGLRSILTDLADGSDEEEMVQDVKEAASVTKSDELESKASGCLPDGKSDSAVSDSQEEDDYDVDDDDAEEDDYDSLFDTTPVKTAKPTSSTASRSAAASDGGPPSKRVCVSANRYPQTEVKQIRELVRKYLLRHPVSINDLLKKLKNKSLLTALQEEAACVLLADVLTELRASKISIKGVTKYQLTK